MTLTYRPMPFTLQITGMGYFFILWRFTRDRMYECWICIRN